MLVLNCPFDLLQLRMIREMILSYSQPSERRFKVQGRSLVLNFPFDLMKFCNPLSPLNVIRYFFMN